jgi:hypothetical protein
MRWDGYGERKKERKEEEEEEEERKREMGEWEINKSKTNKHTQHSTAHIDRQTDSTQSSAQRDKRQ